MEDNEIKEGILRKSEQVVHPDSETDAAFISCVNVQVDMSGHKAHNSCLTKFFQKHSSINVHIVKGKEKRTDSFVQPYSQNSVWNLKCSCKFSLRIKILFRIQHVKQCYQKYRLWLNSAQKKTEGN